MTATRFLLSDDTYSGDVLINKESSVVLRNIAILSIVVLFVFSPELTQAQQPPATPQPPRSENFLPADTRAWISIPSTKILNEHLAKGQFGQLSSAPALQPFIENAKQQIRAWLEDKKIGFDVRLDQFEKIDAGEVCIAGVLPEVPGQESVAGSHGVVLMADVSKDLAAAGKLLGEIEAEQQRQGAVKLGVVQINGIDVGKWEYAKKRKWAKRKRISLQAIVGDWMLISNNEKIFRSVLRRVIKLDPQENGNLANQQPFKLAMAGCQLPNGSPNDVRWFIEPFGYVKLARAIEIENEPVKKMEDDWTAVLARNGMRAIRSVAGTVSVATADQEALFRIFVLAPKDQVRTEEEKRMLSILDFSPAPGKSNAPPAWVPNGVSGSFTGQWNFSNALNGVGPIVDSFMREAGAFKGLLDTMKKDPDFRVDISKLISQLDNQFTLVSAIKKPLEQDSEKLAVGIKLKPGLTADQQTEILDSIGRAVRGQEIMLGGIKAIEDDRTQDLDDLDDLDDLSDSDLVFDDEDEDAKFGGGGGPANQFALFEKKYIAIAKDTLFVCNDKKYLKRLLTSKDKKPLSKKSDLIRMQKMLASLSDPAKVSALRFGRIDKVLELNYAMLRKGELAKSKSLIGKLVNELVANKVGEGGARVKLDISKLPEDYKEISKFLGTLGWVLEDEQSGWRLTGCVLKKE